MRHSSACASFLPSFRRRRRRRVARASPPLRYFFRFRASKENSFPEISRLSRRPARTSPGPGTGTAERAAADRRIARAAPDVAETTTVSSRRSPRQSPPLTSPSSAGGEPRGSASEPTGSDLTGDGQRASAPRSPATSARSTTASRSSSTTKSFSKRGELRDGRVVRIRIASGSGSGSDPAAAASAAAPRPPRRRRRRPPPRATAPGRGARVRAQRCVLGINIGIENIIEVKIEPVLLVDAHVGGSVNIFVDGPRRGASWCRRAAPAPDRLRFRAAARHAGALECAPPPTAPVVPPEYERAERARGVRADALGGGNGGGAGGKIRREIIEDLV